MVGRLWPALGKSGGNSLFLTQFFCEPNTVLKIKNLLGLCFCFFLRIPPLSPSPTQGLPWQPSD